jgi:hypothetical protein
VIHAARIFTTLTTSLLILPLYLSTTSITQGFLGLPHYFKAYEAICRRGRVDSRPSNSVMRRRLMIVDGGAQLSCINDVSLLAPDTHMPTDGGYIQGIIASVSLKVEATGSLKYPLDQV